jgi:hypothetical protein
MLCVLLEIATSERGETDFCISYTSRKRTTDAGKFADCLRCGFLPE